jgi:hypothetical protein
LGPDGTHEIDIEYSRFGSALADNGRWTIFPNEVATPPEVGRSSYQLQLGATPATTSRFTWASNNVAFSTLGGLQPVESSTTVMDSWVYRPADPSTSISQSPMPVHMNLWLDQGNPPTNGQGVEVVIHSFSFAPSVTASVPALHGRWALILAAGLIACAIGRLAHRGRAR